MQLLKTEPNSRPAEILVTSYQAVEDRGNLCLNKIRNLNFRAPRKK
jgi:hypothetical protein